MGEQRLRFRRKSLEDAAWNGGNVNRNTPGSQRDLVVSGSSHQSLQIQPPRGVANCKGHPSLLDCRAACDFPGGSMCHLSSGRKGSGSTECRDEEGCLDREPEFEQ